MPKPEDKLSALFQSLGLDDTKFQATTKAAAQEVEQRWPLFKAVSPQTPKSAPALSAQERQIWSSQEKPEAGAREPGLSMPGLSTELAQSLSQIFERTSAQAAEPTAPKAQEEPLSEPPNDARDFSQEATSNTLSSLFARSPEVVQSVEEASSVLGLFEKIVAGPMAARRDLSGAVHADEPLVSVFSRLQGKEKIVIKPAQRQSSFLGRLGKR